MVAVEDIFPDYGKVYVKPEGDKLLYNGNPFTEQMVKEKDRKPDAQVRVYDSCGQFMGIYQRQGKERYTPVKMFLEKES